MLDHGVGETSVLVGCCWGDSLLLEGCRHWPWSSHLPPFSPRRALLGWARRDVIRLWLTETDSLGLLSAVLATFPHIGQFQEGMRSHLLQQVLFF